MKPGIRVDNHGYQEISYYIIVILNFVLVCGLLPSWDPVVLSRFWNTQNSQFFYADIFKIPERNVSLIPIFFKYTELAVITKIKEAAHTLLDRFFLQLEEVGSQEMLRDMCTYSLKLFA